MASGPFSLRPTIQPVPAKPAAERPLSPWAARYGAIDTGPDDVFNRTPVEHSGYAPDHPKYYGDSFSPEGHGIFLNQDDIDRFFFTDSKYKQQLHNIPAWQLGPMHRALQFSRRGFVPGGHVRSLAPADVAHIHYGIYITERIQVDEDSWFPFFKKDRWWDSMGTDILFDGFRWTVDEPKVWDQLRVAIELANRILKALIKDRHPILETLLYGRLAYWEDEILQPAPSQPPHPNAKVLLSRVFMKQRWVAEYGDAPFVMDQLLDSCDEEQWRLRLEHLAANQQWALVPNEGMDRNRFTGVTFPDQGGLIVLNILYLRSLMSGELTLAERCAALFAQARTIVHELSHSIGHSRRVTDNTPYLSQLRTYEPDGSKDAYNNSEPFLDFGGSAELGYVIEAAIFGGAIRENPLPGNYYHFVGTHKRSWPFPFADGGHGLGLVAGGHPAFRDGADDTLTLIPSLWTSKLLSEEFWQDEAIPRKSDNFFHSLDFFRSEAPYEAATFALKDRPQPIIEQREYLRDQKAQGLLSEGVVDLIADWELRQSLWNQARSGWYELQHKKASKISSRLLPCLIAAEGPNPTPWLESPWSILLARKRFYAFTDELRKWPQQRSMLTCANTAHWLMHTVPWSNQRDKYMADLNERENTWPWHAIGLLMMASIPLRPVDIVSRPNPNAMIQIIYPSSQNPYPAPYKDWWRAEIAASNTIDWTPASQFFDPFDRDGQDIPFGSYTHLDYLDQVKKLVKYFTQSEIPLSKPWLNEIVRAEGVIRQQRMLMRQRGIPEHLCALSWAEGAWDFKIPEYDTALHHYSVSGDVWSEC
ncbi:hypothetical protein F4823DRAFT_634297 [Ustulina deusta]|nr:hypothetical protein F4823DRAFT_634297 [Ustulina deusta]